MTSSFAYVVVVFIISQIALDTCCVGDIQAVAADIGRLIVEILNFKVCDFLLDRCYVVYGYFSVAVRVTQNVALGTALLVGNNNSLLAVTA